MKKVLWLANIPSPYSVDFLNELGKFCDLTVLFERASATDRDDSWKKYRFEHFKGEVLKGVAYSEDKALCPAVCKYLSGSYDVIVVSNMATLTGILAIFYLKLLRKPYIIQGDGGFKKDGKGIKEKLKYFLISGAEGCLSTGQAHDEYYLQYGAAENKIFRIPFTSLFQKDVFKAPATAEEKSAKRAALGLEGDKIVLSIGQFIRRKGFDILLQAAARLSEGTQIYIIGGEPTDEYRGIIKECHVTNVHFMNFVSHDLLQDYFRAADVFVLPTREDIWGLVINEAMACGLPVVTTDACIAGLELIEDGRNGYIVPVESVDELVKATNKVLESDVISLGEKSIEKINAYTFENTAKVHDDIFNDMLKQRNGK